MTVTLLHNAKRLLEGLSGIRIYRTLPHGLDLHRDLSRLHNDIRTIVDVGANVGQAALRLREEFPHAVIHCFEPVRGTFAMLEKMSVVARAVVIELPWAAARSAGPSMCAAPPR